MLCYCFAFCLIDEIFIDDELKQETLQNKFRITDETILVQFIVRECVVNERQLS